VNDLTYETVDGLKEKTSVFNSKPTKIESHPRDAKLLEKKKLNKTITLNTTDIQNFKLKSVHSMNSSIDFNKCTTPSCIL